MVGIYKITSPSNKVYIGQSWNIEKRWKGHKGSNKRKYPISNSILKYGSSQHKFEVVHELPPDVSQEIMDEYEVLYILLYKNCGLRMLNVCHGGAGFKGIPAWNKGKKGVVKMSEATKAKMSLSAKNLDHSLKKGRPMSDSTRLAIFKTNKGRKMTDTQRAHISKVRTEAPNRGGVKNKGVIRSEENRRRISETLRNGSAAKGEGNWNSKFTNDQVIKIREEHARGGISYCAIAKRYGIAKSSIMSIIKRQTWKHI